MDLEIEKDLDNKNEATDKTASNTKAKKTSDNMEISEDLEALTSESNEELEGSDFLNEVIEDAESQGVEEVELESQDQLELSGTELDSFESGNIEEVDFLENAQIISILESLLFATDKPQSINVLKQSFKGTNVKTQKLKQCLDQLQVEYASADRGVELEQTTGGYQLRTKVDNQPFLKRMIKARPFRLTGPALEVLSIVAYKQPCIKFHVDEIRGVESGHLMRALMEKGLVQFAGKSELPGKPMLYQTSKKFLEIFGLRNLKELPTLSEIDELIPEGIVPEEEKKESLDMVSESMGKEAIESYSESEEELSLITDKLSGISTSSDFFEQEKIREKEKRESQKAQDIREAIILDDEVSTRDRNWLERYDEAQKLKAEEAAASSLEDEENSVSSGPEDAVEASDIGHSEDSLETLADSKEMRAEGFIEKEQKSVCEDIELTNESDELDEFVASELKDSNTETQDHSLSDDSASPALLDALAQFDKDEASEDNTEN